MSSPSSQPFSYHRFDPLNDASEETNLPAIAESTSGAVVAAPNGQTLAGDSSGDEPSSSNSETVSDTEGRRARHLLDRAFALWEKGDNSGAILACRQSLTIDSQAAGAYSMLGLLLERAGDVKGAIAAYDKAVELEPDSVLERDSAQRLRAASQSNAAPMFHFEDAELFDTSSDTSTNDLPALAEPASASQNANLAAPVTNQAATNLIATPTSAPLSSTQIGAPTVATSAVATLTNKPNTPPRAATNAAVDAASLSGATLSGATILTAPTTSNPTLPKAQTTGVASAPRSPVATAPVSSGAVTATMVAPATAAPATVAPRVVPSSTVTPTSTQTPRAAGQIAPVVASSVVMPRQTPATGTNRQVNPLPVALPSSMPVASAATPSVLLTDSTPTLMSSWQSARTFWMRSLPLVAVAGTGFLFMLWSRGVALDRERHAVPSTSSTTVINTVAGATTPTTTSVADNVAPLQNAGATNAGAANANTSSTGNSNVNVANAGVIKSTVASSGVPATTLPTPSGLIVNNAPAKTTVTNTASSANTNRADRVETRRERRARREDNSGYSGNANREAERPTSRLPRGGMPAPDVSSIPPANVSSLPRSSNDAGASSASNGALPPIIQVPPSDGGNGGQSNNGGNAGGNNGTQPDSGPLPAFPPPSQVQSRTQNQMSEGAPSASSENSSAVRAADTAYKYQTRALIYVEQGNNSRAASDFQSAMALYRRQIARGENVDDARRGLEACRDGLKLITAS